MRMACAVIGMALMLGHRAHAQCENGGRSLAGMAAAKEVSFSMVPSDVQIDRRSPPLRVTGWLWPMERYSLPTERSMHFERSATPWTVFGEPVECRVQTPDGRWWLAFRHFGRLSYTSEDEVRSRLSR